jgi:cyclopropane-fatty-acyl-phospholipid synthase
MESIRDVKLPKAAVSVFASMAKSTLFKKLEHLQFGRLIISDGDGDEVHVFGEPAENAVITARIDVYDVTVYKLLVEKGMLGCGEGYIHGMWSSPDLVALIRLMARNMNTAKALDKKSFLAGIFLKAFDFLHSNSLHGSKKNISAHYDLGNDFFKLFLDSRMMYSSAVYPHKDATLEVAAEYKLDMICKKLNITDKDSVLEIGTGWGGFACYAAKKYGCKVTTTTISQEQYNKAVSEVDAQQLSDKVTVLLEDYRLLTGTFDKLVSIEMIEAVGHEFYAEYFSQCSRLLKSDGEMLIQSILVSDQRYDYARKNTDYIKRYIFPGGCLPSQSVIANHVAKNTDMQVMAVNDITYDYAKTLAQWRERFLAALPKVRENGFSEEFIRMWDFYFCYCQAGFMERSIHTAQFVLAKPLWRDERYPNEC